MVSDALWQGLFVTDNVLPLPTVHGMVFYGWFDENGTRFTDNAGNLLVTPDEYVVLYACFYPVGYTPITTAEELKNISLDGKYALVCDIDLGGAEWTPIGTSDDPFTGEFDGNGYTVSNFKITTGRQCVGLFGYNKGVIKNLGVENFTVNVSYSGNVYAGGLVGRNYGGSILNSYAAGDVSATSSDSNAYAGGLVGRNDDGSILNSYATGNVSATSSRSSSSSYLYAYAGGLVGSNNGGNITNCYATGNVRATSTSSSTNAYAGGLVGSGGSILNSYAAGDVSATGSYNAYAGGLVGSGGSILNSYATGNVRATSTSTSSSHYAYAGGLVGSGGSIANSYATGTVSATSYRSAYAGGLVGSGGSIANSYATGNVSATSTAYSTPIYFDYAYAGGLVGYNDGGNITNCYATGNVSATSSISDCSAYAGGLVGRNDGSILNSYATGNVSATATSTSTLSSAYVGGLVGSNSNSGSIMNCYRYSGQTFYRKKGSTTYSTASNTLGTAVSLENFKSPSWVYKNLWTAETEIWDFSNGYPTLDYEYIDSVIITISTAEELERLQGQTLVLSYELKADIDLGGMEWTPVAIFYGTFDGNGYTVSNFKITTGRTYVGLFGYNVGVIENLGVENFTVNVSYSGVSAGGLVGSNSGSILNSYAAGDVSATSTSYSANAGGLVGDNSGSITNSYATGNVSATGSSNAYAGGLVGVNNSSGDITNSYATGEVSATSTSTYDSAYAGGLVGYNSGDILNSYATGNVSATSYSSSASAYAGGLVGYNSGGSITNSYATGDVRATGSSSYVYAGGLVGYNYNSGDILNSYATGNVSATSSGDYAYAGGLVGYNTSSGNITNSYATGDVSATGSAVGAGGLVGYNAGGSITNCYRYSGQTFYRKLGSATYSTASNAFGTEEDLTTLQSVSFNTSTLGWDDSVWKFVEGAFPTLKNAGTAMAR